MRTDPARTRSALVRRRPCNYRNLVCQAPLRDQGSCIDGNHVSQERTGDLEGQKSDADLQLRIRLQTSACSWRRTRSARNARAYAAFSPQPGQSVQRFCTSEAAERQTRQIIQGQNSLSFISRGFQAIHALLWAPTTARLGRRTLITETLIHMFLRVFGKTPWQGSNNGMDTVRFALVLNLVSAPPQSWPMFQSLGMLTIETSFSRCGT